MRPATARLALRLEAVGGGLRSADPPLSHTRAHTHTHTLTAHAMADPMSAALSCACRNAAQTKAFLPPTTTKQPRSGTTGFGAWR